MVAGTVRVPLDFSDVESYDLIEAGVYPAVIEKLTYRPEKDDKSASISVEYTVTAEEHKGRKLWQNLYFSPKAIFRMKDFFDAFGLTDEELAGLEYDEETGVVVEPDLTGIVVEIKTFVDTYKGKESNKVDDPPFVVDQPKPKAAAAEKGEGKGKAARKGGRGLF